MGQRNPSQNRGAHATHLSVVEGEGRSTVNVLFDDSPIDTVAETIIRAHKDRVLFLYERRPWGHRRALPLVVVAPSGVHLVSPLNFPGRAIRPSADGTSFWIDGILHGGPSRAMGEDCDALAAALSTGPVPEVGMSAFHCVVAGNAPRRGFEVDGVRVVGLKRIAKAISRSGPLSEKEREAIHMDLVRRFERL